MIEIGLDPFLRIGSLSLSWHAIWSLIGMAAAVAVAARFARGLATFDQVYAIAITGIVGGLIGSRALHVIEEWPQAYAHDPIQALAVWNGGASITGGMIGGALAGAWRIARFRTIPFGRILDVGAIGLGVGMGVARIGDIWNGEHHAAACADLPWCVRYTHPDSPGQRESVHPAVAYEMLWDLVAVAIVAWLFARAPRLGLDGRLLAIFFGIYGVGRFAISSLRLDGPWLFGIAQAQLLSIGFVVWATSAILSRPRTRRTYPESR